MDPLLALLRDLYMQLNAAQAENVSLREQLVVLQTESGVQ